MGIPHITAKPDGSVHLLLPPDGRAIMDELQDTLTPGQFELHGGWRDVTVYVAEALTAVRIVLRHCPHADDASQGVKPWAGGGRPGDGPAATDEPIRAAVPCNAGFRGLPHPVGAFRTAQMIGNGGAQMAGGGTTILHRISDTTLTVKDPDEDVRGRKVVDKAGEEIGVVNDLLIDDRELKVRFLRVGSGGILGLGATQILIPVEAVTRVTAEAVHIEHTRAHVAGGPGYDVALTTARDYWGELYGYYGYSPHEHPNYTHPDILGRARDFQTS